MYIKAFAKSFHVSDDTIRYYEKEGLLWPERLSNGYRVYNESCIEQMKAIVVFKKLGFSLQEMKQLFELKAKPLSRNCNQTTVQLFNEKIRALQQHIIFYENAIATLTIVNDLMHENKYQENEQVIEQMMLDLFNEGERMI